MSESFAMYTHWNDSYYAKNVKCIIMFSDGTWESFNVPFVNGIICNRLNVRNFMNLRIVTQNKYTKEETRNYIQNRIEELEKIVESQK